MKRNDDYYYSDNYGSSGGRRGRSLAGIVFDFLAAVATAAFALALIVAYRHSLLKVYRTWRISTLRRSVRLP